MGQRLLSLMDHYRGDGGTLNEQILWRQHGPCDAAALSVAVDRLTARHEALRTTFRSRGPKLTQVVHDPRPVPLRRVDVSAEPDPVAAARRIVGEEVSTPIDAANWPTRATLVRLAPEEHLFALTMHHYVTDDWSNALLSREIRELYRNPEASLPPVRWQYGDWSQWHHEALRGQRRQVLDDYWRGALAGAQVPRLPTRAVPPAAGEPPWLSVEHDLPAETVAGLRRLARQHRTTLFPILLSLFYLLLSRVTGQRDLTVATLLANRDRPEVRETVGFFVTMVPLRGRVDPDEPFDELVRRTRAAALGAMRHQELPYQLLPPETLAGPGRLDDVVFQLLGTFGERADLSGEEVDDMDAQLARRRFGLEFVLVPRGEVMTVLLMGSRERYEPAWADRFVRDYVALAAQLCEEGVPQAVPAI